VKYCLSYARKLLYHIVDVKGLKAIMDFGAFLETEDDVSLSDLPSARFMPVWAHNDLLETAFEQSLNLFLSKAIRTVREGSVIIMSMS
jgi:hypothetical protein